MIVANVGRPQGPAATAPRPANTAFSVPAGAERTTAPAATSAAIPLDGMLALQEQEADAVRDRQARNHGQSLLQALAALQHILLFGRDAGAALERLASLAEAPPAAADPALAAIVQAIALRARVELARRGL